MYGSSNFERWLVHLFKKYIGLLLNTKECNKLYSRCKKNPTPSVWYYDQSYGVNKLKGTVRELCKDAGIDGKYPLCATCASRMFDKNVPEQIIKEITGHKSDCVRVYKRTADHLREAASKTISGEGYSKKVKLEEESHIESDVAKTDDSVELLSFNQIVENVNRTKEEIHKKMYP